MILHNDASFKVYFGDSKDDCVKSDGHPNDDYFQKLQDELKVNNLVFLKQVHGKKGICIKSPSELNKKLILFEEEGDFIVTNQRNVGVGMVTADCLPVVFYDPVHHASAIVHVGWKGAVYGIVSSVIEKMRECFNTNPEELTVYFGPSAKVCCYSVGSDFSKNLEHLSFNNDILIQKEDSLYFDLPKLVLLQLVEFGISRKDVKIDYNSCTICDLRFHSYRRSNQGVGRQATIVILK
jgi:polyphenol oxidase